MLKDLITHNRSYRRFYQDVQIDYNTLEELVNLARLSASAANKQPLKYILFNEPTINKEIFGTLAWAAYLKDWVGPEEGERPSAYIIVINDTEIASPFPQVDLGIACQSILLGAIEIGLGGCILAGINKNKLREILNLPEQYEILAVIALGKPKETVVIEAAKDDIKYWRDSEDVHHVPKRTLKEIVLKF